MVGMYCIKPGLNGLIFRRCSSRSPHRRGRVLLGSTHGGPGKRGSSLHAPARIGDANRGMTRLGRVDVTCPFLRVRCVQTSADAARLSNKAKGSSGVHQSHDLREADLKQVPRGQEDLDCEGCGLPGHNYLTEPLSVDALKQLLRSAGLRPQDALRTNEEAYRQFVAGRDLSDDEIVRIMADHPELIQRPIVTRGDKAVLARPVDRLAKLDIEYDSEH